MTCCDNCGDDRGVRLVTYDTMVDGPGCLESVELCRVCRGGAEEIRDERDDEDVYEGTE
jgi:hypothetical protein